MESEVRGPYQLFMFAMCVIAIAFLGLQLSRPTSSDTKLILEYADFCICMIFLADFLYVLARSKDRLRYLRTWGWIDLLSSIPVLGPLRLGRAVRLVRILRVFRGIRSTRVIAHILLSKRRESAFLAAVTLALLLVVCSSLAILQFEVAPQSNITNGADAMWWAVSTMSTVGYGDFYPVTTEGRVVAVLLMAGGVGLFGTFSALLAAWFISPRPIQQ